MLKNKNKVKNTHWLTEDYKERGQLLSHEKDCIWVSREDQLLLKIQTFNTSSQSKYLLKNVNKLSLKVKIEESKAKTQWIGLLEISIVQSLGGPTLHEPMGIVWVCVFIQGSVCQFGHTVLSSCLPTAISAFKNWFKICSY